MASIFLRPILHPHIMGVGLGLSLSNLAFYRQLPVKLDSKPMMRSTETYQAAAYKPARQNGYINPTTVRQISKGSISGLCAGMAVSIFSRPLVMLLGLLVVCIQWAASYGIHVLPYSKIRRYVTNVDLKSALQNNIAFKMSFGMTFAMSAFMHF